MEVKRIERPINLKLQGIGILASLETTSMKIALVFTLNSLGRLFF